MKDRIEQWLRRNRELERRRALFGEPVDMVILWVIWNNPDGSYMVVEVVEKSG